MAYVPRVLLLTTFAIGIATMPTAGHAEEKIEGKVARTNLTLCQPRPTGGGCEGTFVLETRADGRDQQVTIRVTFDTIIRKGQEYLLLPATRGNSVVVGYITEKGQKVAKSIDVIGAAQ